MGAHVTYACPGDAREHPEHKTSGSMVALLEGHPWVDGLIPTHEGPETNWLPEFDAAIMKDGKPCYDYFIPIMGLPNIFRTTVETIPAQYPYLPRPRPDLKITLPEARVRRGARVGLCWKAGEVLDPRRHRSLTTAQAEQILQVNHVEWINLQYQTAAPRLIESPAMDDWLDTQNVIDSLDLVLTVDSGVMHLAAAMGKRNLGDAARIVGLEVPVEPRGFPVLSVLARFPQSRRRFAGRSGTGDCGTQPMITFDATASTYTNSVSASSLSWTQTISVNFLVVGATLWPGMTTEFIA